MGGPSVAYVPDGLIDYLTVVTSQTALLQQPASLSDRRISRSRRGNRAHGRPHVYGPHVTTLSRG